MGVGLEKEEGEGRAVGATMAIGTGAGWVVVVTVLGAQATVRAGWAGRLAAMRFRGAAYFWPLIE